MSKRPLSVLDGNTFVVGDRLGDLRPDSGREHGFFSEDTRCVSRWVRRATSAVRVELEFDADLADLFEVNSGAVARREVTWRGWCATRARGPVGGVAAVGRDC